MVETVQSASGLVWDHVFLDQGGRDWLAGQGLDSLVLAALVAEDTRPRVSEFDGGAVVVLRGVNLNAGAEAEDMISVRLWVTEARVISVWLRPLRAVARLSDASDTLRGGGDFVARLALTLGETASPVVAGLGERIDALEEAMIDPALEFRQADLSDLRRVLIMLKRYFTPQSQALEALSTLQVDWMSDRDQQRLTEAREKMVRLTEELEALLSRAQVMQDHLAARRADHMNRQMYVLSVVAALFLPLGFVTGLLGINVGGMPGVDWSAAFWVVCAVLVVLGVAQWLVFRAMGIVGPRRDQDF